MDSNSKKAEAGESKPTLLFVYGTLLRGMENAAFLQSPEKATFYSRGTIQGKLYDLGYFPAYVKTDVSQTGLSHEITGEIYEIKHPEVLFETLDLIEGYNHQHPERSLFIRERTIARTEKGKKEVWVYIYNQSLDGCRLIESGDYRKRRKTMYQKQTKECLL
ncbi:MAG: gamma-glutamylcyclotransferase [bacterium]